MADELDGNPFDFTPEMLGDLPAELLTPAGIPFTRDDQAVTQRIDEQKMTVDFVIVTRTKQVNRHGNMVQIVSSDLGGGLMTDVYERSGAVLFDHGYDPAFGGLPVASAIDPNGTAVLSKSAGKVTSRAHFCERIPASELIFAATAEGLLRMSSIGFLPRRAIAVQVRPPKLAEGVEDISIERWRGFDFVEAELLEWSITASGADRGAFRQAVERGRVHNVRIPDRMRPAFQRIAEPKPAVGIGADFSSEPEEQQAIATASGTYSVEVNGVTIVGDDLENVQRAHDAWVASEQPPAATPTPAASAETQQVVDSESQPDTLPTITPQSVIAAMDRREAQRADGSIEQVMQRIGDQLEERIDAAFESLQTAQAETRQELRRLQGKVD